MLYNINNFILLLCKCNSFICNSVFAMKIATYADKALNKTILYCTKWATLILNNDYVLDRVYYNSYSLLFCITEKKKPSDWDNLRHFSL